MTRKEREIGLLETINHAQDYWDAELIIGIKGQRELQVKQLSAMEKCIKTGMIGVSDLACGLLAGRNYNYL